MPDVFAAITRLTGAELVRLAQSTRATPLASTSPAPPAIRAVSDPNGRAWRVEGPGWTMAPIGCVSAAEAEAICQATALALLGAAIPARG